MEQAAKVLLEQIVAEDASISETLHRLSRRRKILQEAATKLRTGVSAAVVEAHMEAALPARPAAVSMRRVR